jgi:protein required for attachment to host cells
MPKKSRTWIMVADAARAQLFLNEGPQEPIEPIDSMENPNAHLRDRDLVSDKPGRSIESVGGAHHAEERIDHHRADKAAFARRVAEYVDRGAAEKKFDKLVLIAPPQMLGDLRGALGQHSQARVTHQVAKDLTKLPVAKLQEQLLPLIRP